MSNTSQDPITDRIVEIAEAAVADSELFLVHVDVRGRTGSRVLGIFVDADEPPTLDSIAGLSREIEATLDAEDFIPGGYRLEVSTPGAAEPLRKPRQYRKHIGRTLEVLPSGKDTPLTGKLVDITDSHIEIEDGDSRTAVPLESIERATVKLPW